MRKIVSEIPKQDVVPIEELNSRSLIGFERLGCRGIILNKPRPHGYYYSTVLRAETPAEEDKTAPGYLYHESETIIGIVSTLKADHYTSYVFDNWAELLDWLKG